MAIREQTYEKRIDEVLLTNNNTAKLVAQRIDKYGLLLDVRIKFFDVNNFVHFDYIFVSISPLLRASADKSYPRISATFST